MSISGSTWENVAYEFANDCMEASWEEHRNGNKFQSWGLTVPARFAYLSDVIINTVISTAAMVATVFMGLVALATCNCKNKTFLATKAYTLESYNHFFMSLVGIVSPALAHKYQDANIFKYVFAIRIIAMSALGIYYFANYPAG